MSILQDFRFALRLFRRNPAFSAAAVGLLAVGVGANTAVFSLADGLLFRPLPYREPERLAFVHEGGFFGVPRAAFEAMRRHSGFEGVVTSELAYTRVLRGAAGAETMRVDAVSEGYLELLGVRPALGRLFRAEEFRAGQDRVAVLSHGAWVRRFGADDSVVGRRLDFEEGSVEIVGVLAPNFVYTDGTNAPPEILVPLVLVPPAQYNANHRAFPLVRLRPGVGLGAARAEAQAILDAVVRQHGAKPGRPLELVSVREHLFGPYRPALLMLLGATGCVLLIASANLASLMLARGMARVPELAVRAALGAGRARLVRLLLAEAVVLGLAGGLVGLVAAGATFDLLLAQVPERAHVYRMVRLGLDYRVALFSLVLALVAGAIVGVAPAMRLCRAEIHDALRAGRAGVAGPSRRGGVLIAVEAALTAILLFGAVLLARSYGRLVGVDLGFETRDTISVAFTLPPARYPTSDARALFCRQLLEDVRRISGVEAAALGPIPGLVSGDRPLLKEGAPLPNARVFLVGSDYFRTLGIRIVRGRAFDDREAWGGLPVALVNESAARLLWPAEDPVGKTWSNGAEPPRTIVGLIADTRSSFRRTGRPAAYVPLDATSFRAPPSLVVLAPGATRAVTLAIRSELQRLDPRLPAGVRPLDYYFDADLAPARFQLRLVGVFGVLALLLAAAGIFGVVGYAVSRRTHEIGIRIALGAEPRSIVASILTQAIGPVAAGGAVGLAAAPYAARALRGVLFELTPGDPLSVALSALVLLAAACLAGYLPARRASRVDPIVTLRCE